MDSCTDSRILAQIRGFVNQNRVECRKIDRVANRSVQRENKDGLPLRTWTLTVAGSAFSGLQMYFPESDGRAF